MFSSHGQTLFVVPKTGYIMNERVNEKRGHETSEPEDFLKLAERMNSWALMVALIGEGLILTKLL
jgi:hypothetical protein